MLRKLFQFINKSRGSVYNSKPKTIYQTLTNELKSKHKNKHYDYIIKRVRSLKWNYDIPDKVIIYISDECLKGRRSSEIAKEVPGLIPGITAEEAKILSQTISSIQSTNIDRLRAQDIGLNWYVWRTSEDSAVRDSHKIMDKVLVNWNDPPSPEALNDEESVGHYHAGEMIGCRCYTAPLTSIDRVTWPHNVYMNGNIFRMTKTQFKKLQ